MKKWNDWVSREEFPRLFAPSLGQGTGTFSTNYVIKEGVNKWGNCLNVMLYSTVIEGVPLIQAVNAQHGLQRLGVTAIADLRINGLNEGSILD